MEWLDLTLPAPAQNLALDEALLEAAETTGGPELLRFWEPAEPFVVLGYGKKAAAEVFLENCSADGVPVYRRASGGGTVLQAPGCFNYALILDMDTRPGLRSLTGSNREIMSRHEAALQTLIPSVTLRGITDLAIADQKFMGNAQRRKRRFLLFHGTILTRLDAALLERYLRMPADRPDYRNDRPHRDFVTFFPSTPGHLRRVLRESWSADRPISPARIPHTAVEALVLEKYGRPDWNLKY